MSGSSSGVNVGSSGYFSSMTFFELNESGQKNRRWARGSGRTPSLTARTVAAEAIRRVSIYSRQVSLCRAIAGSIGRQGAIATYGGRRRSRQPHGIERPPMERGCCYVGGIDRGVALVVVLRNVDACRKDAEKWGRDGLLIGCSHWAWPDIPKVQILSTWRKLRPNLGTVTVRENLGRA
jgi:hypothetical protein